MGVVGEKNGPATGRQADRLTQQGWGGQVGGGEKLNIALGVVGFFGDGCEQVGLRVINDFIAGDDVLNVDVIAMGFEAQLGCGFGVVSLHQGVKVGALQFMATHGDFTGGAVELTQVVEGLRKAGVQFFVPVGVGECVTNHGELVFGGVMMVG